MVVGSFLCLLKQAFSGDEMDNFFCFRQFVMILLHINPNSKVFMPCKEFMGLKLSPRRWVLEISCRQENWNSSSPYLCSEEKEKEKLMYVHGNQNSSSILCYQEEERLMYVHGTRILQAHLCKFVV